MFLLKYCLKQLNIHSCLCFVVIIVTLQANINDGLCLVVTIIFFACFELQFQCRCLVLHGISYILLFNFIQNRSKVWEDL